KFEDPANQRANFPVIFPCSQESAGEEQSEALPASRKSGLGPLLLCTWSVAEFCEIFPNLASLATYLPCGAPIFLLDLFVGGLCGQCAQLDDLLVQQCESALQALDEVLTRCPVNRSLFVCKRKHGCVHASTNSRCSAGSYSVM